MTELPRDKVALCMTSEFFISLYDFQKERKNATLLENSRYSFMINYENFLKISLNICYLELSEKKNPQKHLAEKSYDVKFSCTICESNPWQKLNLFPLVLLLATSMI